MAKQPFDAFLPSGAVEQPYYGPPTCEPGAAVVAAMASPPGPFQEYIPSQIPGGRSSSPRPCLSPPHLDRPRFQRQTSTSIPPQAFAINQHQHQHQHQRARPLSPPFSRSSSAEESRAAQIQSWRLYTQHLRETAQGARAHMEADRARLEEVMAEERTLWDQERGYLKGRIEELEAQLAAVYGYPNLHNGQHEFDTILGGLPMPQNGQDFPPQHSDVIASGPTTVNDSSSKTIPQESGRNPDGSPFYAPASRNPSRTFDARQSNDLRVDSMSAPRETPLRVTSKELKKSDFGLQSAPVETSSRDGSIVSESIDISHLQPELEGVPIKASAVAPEFAAKVLSPNASLSPSKPSPNVDSPTTRRDTSWNPEVHRSGSQAKRSTLEIIAVPETHRLTMNAGHTPNHSIHKIDLGDSGNATPTQSQHQVRSNLVAIVPSELQVNENVDPDPELRGPLGLRNDAPKDEMFLTALTEKLNEIKEGRFTAPNETFLDNGISKGPSHGAISGILLEKQNGTSAPSAPMDHDDSEQAVDEVPLLRVKASMNFGRPFGSL